MVKSLPFKCDSDTRTKTKRSRQNELQDWVTKLVTAQNDVVIPTSTKSERKEKRLAKKRRNDETKHQMGNKTKKPVVETREIQDSSITRRPEKASNYTSDFRIKSTDSIQKSRNELSTLSEQLQQCVALIKERRKSWQKPYAPDPVVSHNTAQRRRQQLANNMEIWFQPRQSNYGGIGLARPSLLIALDDPSWQAKLEEEFVEHIPGFYGKQRTKAMKKQLDGQMLWRQLQKQKLAVGSSSSLPSSVGNNQHQLIRGIKGKTLSQLNPDERIEAMIRAGYI